MSLLAVPVSAHSSVRCTSSRLSFLCSRAFEECLQSSRRIVLPSEKCLRTTEQEWAPVLCFGSARLTLDDVERLSRGRASKSKIGSRSVPHRLNVDERKAYELAKKRGFVVHQPNTRHYPLINSHRNYCEALGIPCIRIDQGLASRADEVVMDLSPLHLSEVDLQSFKELVIMGVVSVRFPNNQASDPSVGEEIKQASDGEDSLDSNKGRSEDAGDMDAQLSLSTERDSRPLRFQASSRSEAKLIAQTGVDIWKSWAKSNLKVIA